MYSGSSSIPPAIPQFNMESASDSTAGADLSGKYDVFLSFCGKDTGKGFTDYLYTYLTGAGVRTFRDDNELRVREEIGSNLLKAIQDSKILIPVFSKNYASSKWCMFELKQMVDSEAEAEGEKMFIPIFYDVDPSDVRNQSWSYEEAFRQHEKTQGFDEKTIQGWKEGLTKVGGLPGFELKKESNGHEGKLVKIIVEKVLLKLRKKYVQVPNNLVGMDNHIEQLMGSLELDSKVVRIVGICGMGGLGKTTIAKVIYNQLCHRFEGHCFLEDVRENLKHKDVILNLQNQLITEIQNKDVAKFVDNYEESYRIEEMFRGRKVLIILDDVDGNFHVNMLMENQSWFGAHSRIIITTRDASVLHAIDLACRSKDLLCVYESYQPTFIDDHDSLQLFSMYAFKRDSPLEGYEILSKEVVSIAAGLPIVLVVLGSVFFGVKNKAVWEEILTKLRNIPQQDVQEKLRYAFESLEYEQKQIFLDIACFFSGMDIVVPCYMWDSCEFHPRGSLSILLSRCLITISNGDKIRMHDLLRDLGRQIVREENWNNLGQRSRLWYEEEAMQILETRQGTSSVNALSLPFKGFPLPKQIDRIIDAQAFHSLTRLRYLSMECQDIDGDFKHGLSNLRWLRYRGSSGKFNPTNLHLKNLVVLDLSEGYFTEDWKVWSQFKMATKLKVLDLSWCGSIRLVPDLSTFSSLEILKISSCMSLCRLDGLEHLKSLKCLDASSCVSLEVLQSLANLRDLAKLYLRGCENLIETQGLDKLESLEILDITGCSSLKSLPNFSGLEKLRILRAVYCYNLIQIEGLQRLDSLEHLDLSFCSSLKEIPNLSNLIKLKEFKFSNPPDLGRLRSSYPDVKGLHNNSEPLQYDQKQIFLDIACLFIGMDITRPYYMWDGCGLYPFEGISVLVSRSLISVSDDNKLIMHNALRDLGRKIIRDEGLKELGRQSRLWCKQEAMHVLETHQGTKDVEALYLDFVSEDLEFRPNRLVGDDFVNLPNLRFLVLGSVDLDGDFEFLFTNIKWLKWAPPGSFSPMNFYVKNLVILDLSYSKITDDWKGWSQIKMTKHLKVLDLSHCYSLTTTNHFSMFVTLEQLILSNCFGLVEIDQSFGNLINLRLLDLSNCLVLRGMLNCEKFANLESLDVSCTKLCDLRGFGELKYLRSLNTSGCRFIVILSDLSNLKMLWKLDTSGCVKLSEIQGLEKLKYLQHFNLRGCLSMERIPDISELKMLEEVNIAKCNKLHEVDSLGNLEYLVTLDLSFCTSLNSVPNFSKFRQLKKLRICGLKTLDMLDLEVLESLELLDVTGCKSIRKLPLMRDLKQLKEIYACRCVELAEIIGLEEVSSLEFLDISGCVSIERLSNLSNLKRLRVVKASGCIKLSEIRGLEELKCLELLNIRGCELLKSLPDLPNTRLDIN